MQAAEGLRLSQTQQWRLPVVFGYNVVLGYKRVACSQKYGPSGFIVGKPGMVDF